MKWSRVLLVLVAVAYSIVVPRPVSASTQRTGVGPRVNAPYQPGAPRYPESAIFWFGHLSSTDNYTDVRVGYNDDQLFVRLSTIDRWLWYDADPSPQDLTSWDSAVLYLDLGGNAGALDSTSYRFVAQMYGGFGLLPANRMAAYRGEASGWVASPVPFFPYSVWRGDSPNNNVSDSGWVLTFFVPFASLGLSGPPSQGTIWGMALAVHDRDDASDAPIAPKAWPEAVDANSPATWGQLAFGLRSYHHAPAIAEETWTIRHGLSGATVVDGAVGGSTTCGAGTGYWNGWGDTNYAGQERFNVQNQWDISDWPCFSKYYVTFPLPPPPAGKVLISATMTLNECGSAGQGTVPPPAPSYIQVLTVSEDWQEGTLTWNNAPWAAENVAGTYVGPVDDWIKDWPKVFQMPYNWDVSWAVVDALSKGQPLRLAVYSADSAYDSGRYFFSSDIGEWNASGRPTLTVTWGSPTASPHSIWVPMVQN